MHVLQNECVLLEQSRETIVGIEDQSFATDYLFGDSETVTKDILIDDVEFRMAVSYPHTSIEEEHFVLELFPIRLKYIH